MSASLVTNLAVILATLGVVQLAFGWADRRKAGRMQDEAPDCPRERISRRLQDLSA